MSDHKGLGPLEHQIMQIVWTQKKANVYSVAEKLCQEKKLAYTTIMTVMSRLAKKGMLTREKRGKTYFYSPKETKNSFIHSMVKSSIEKMIDMFGEEAAVAFIKESQSLSKPSKRKLISKIDAN
jgi:predicted transcriptional regulator